MPSLVVVDPDAGTLGTIAAAALEGHGYVVRVACAVATAIRTLQHKTFDCVLVDEDIEEASNGQLGAELSRYPPQTVCLIVFSSSPTVSRLKALQRGAFECIEKPCDPALLRLLVGRAIERVTLTRTTRALLEEVEVANAELREATTDRHQQYAQAEGGQQQQQ